MFSNRFNTKNDPILEAVEGAMKDGEVRRQAEALVNEEFGVYSRKAVVREHLAAYDARLEEAYKCMKEGDDTIPGRKLTPDGKLPPVGRGMSSKEIDPYKGMDLTTKGVKEELAKKDYDKDGKIESPKDEVWGSRLRAAKMAGKLKEEEQIDEGAHKALKAAGFTAGRKGSDTGFGRSYSHPKHGSAYVDADGFAHFGSGKKTTVTHGAKDTAAHLGKLKEEQIDEVSKKTAIRAYRERESQHRGEYNQGWGSEGQNPNDDYGERSGKKALKTLSRIGKKFGSKTAAQAKRGAEVDSSGRGHGGKSDYLSAKERVYSKFSKPTSKKGTKERKDYMSMNKGRFAKEDYELDEAAYSAKAGRAGKDLGKPGKSFKKIAAKAGERYGSEERGKRVAGAILKRIRAKHMEEQVTFMPSAGAKPKVSGFGAEFAKQRASGAKTFSYNGKSYSTALKGSSAPASKPAATSTATDSGTRTPVAATKTSTGISKYGTATGKDFASIDKKSSAVPNSPARPVDRETTSAGPNTGGEKGITSGNTVSLDRPTPTDKPATSPSLGVSKDSTPGGVDAFEKKVNTPSAPPVATKPKGGMVTGGTFEESVQLGESVQVGTSKYRIV
jgi:hypothetical protein